MQRVCTCAAYEGRAFQFHKIRDNVYHAVGTGELSVIYNSTVIVNETDVMIVDTHVTPAAAWALQRELRSITSNPIRYVINTHYHYDHSHGNQAFGLDVEIIGHEFTRQAMLAGDSISGLAYDRMTESIPTNIAGLKAQLEAASEVAQVRHTSCTKSNGLHKPVGCESRHKSDGIQSTIEPIEMHPESSTDASSCTSQLHEVGQTDAA